MGISHSSTVRASPATAGWSRRLRPAAEVSGIAGIGVESAHIGLKLGEQRKALCRRRLVTEIISGPGEHIDGHKVLAVGSR